MTPTPTLAASKRRRKMRQGGKRQPLTIKASTHFRYLTVLKLQVVQLHQQKTKMKVRNSDHPNFTIMDHPNLNFF